MPVEVMEKCIARLEQQKMNRRFSALAPAPAIQPKLQGQTNRNIGPSIPRNQSNPVATVPGQFQGGICASTPGSKLQELRNKRAWTNGPAIRSYTPQVPTVNKPYIPSASHHELSVPLNRDVAHFGLAANLGHSSNLMTRRVNIAEEQCLTHKRPKQW